MIKTQKDPKLLVRVTCSNKNFYLNWERDAWRIRFSVPADIAAFWKEKGVELPKQIDRTTGTPHIGTAKVSAQKIIESVFKCEQAAPAQSIKAHEHFAPLAEIIKRYREGARTLPDNEDLLHNTITKNIQSFLILVESRFDEKGNPTSRKDHHHMTAEVLTGKLVENFKSNWLKRAVADGDLMEITRKKNTVNAYIRQARSLFARDYMPLYKGLKLPAATLPEFMQARQFRGMTWTSRYRPIPQTTIDAMDAEIQALRAHFHKRDGQGNLTSEALQARGMYLAFYMMLWLGMRVNEVRHARLEWIEEWPEQTKIAIVRRSYFKPKGIPGTLPIAPSLVADIHELSGASEPMDFIIPAPHKTARHNLMKYTLSQFVRRHLGDDRTKTCHELRKHAVSMVLMQSRDWIETQRFSRHADVQTLRKHYEGFLDDLKPITSSDWRKQSPQPNVINFPKVAPAQ
jgi:integrase